MSDGRFWKIDTDYKNLLFCKNTIHCTLKKKTAVDKSKFHEQFLNILTFTL